MGKKGDRDNERELVLLLLHYIIISTPKLLTHACTHVRTRTHWV